MPELLAGLRLCDRFTLERPLGRGGMAQVWLARDDELGEAVALKVLHQDLAARAGMVDLLREECRRVRRLAHPNIVRVFDFHRAEGRFFISMELVDGGDATVLGDMAWTQAIATLLPVIDALAYAHQQGIVHRDIKARNVLFDSAGRPRLTDFGVAGVVHSALAAQQGFAGGTPEYMAPQQRAGAPPDPADDVFALGRLIEEMLRVAAQAGDQPAAGLGVTPQALRSLLTRMTDPQVARRPAGMAAVSAQLRALLDGETVHTLPPEPAPEWSAEATAPGLKQPSTPPPVSMSPPLETEQRGWRTAAVFAISFAGLLIGLAAVWVFYFLPDLVRKEQPGSPPAPVAAEPARNALPATTPAERPAEPPLEPRPIVEAPVAKPSAPERYEPETVIDDAGSRKLTLEQLALVDESREQLERWSVAKWANAQYQAALQVIEEADRLYRERRYDAAAQGYTQALGALQKIHSMHPAVVEGLLEQAATALAAEELEEATRLYGIVSQVDPGSTQAAHGMELIEAHRRVAVLLGEALEHEQAGRLQDALAAYTEAVSLDPESAQGADGERRVRGRIEAQRFQQAMSRGLKALQKGRYGAAREAFEQAARIRPRASEPRDALASVNERERLAQIDALRAKALSMEAGEQWSEAIKKYEQILGIDGNLVFARDGRKRVQRFFDLKVRVNSYLSEPQRLSSLEPLDNARRLLGEMTASEPLPKGLAADMAALADKLDVATSPMSVAFQSDNATEVVVYRVGRLGRFEQRELKLRPGTYTVVGTRDGYRDVRLKLTVNPGQAPAPVIVRCRERV